MGKISKKNRRSEKPYAGDSHQGLQAPSSVDSSPPGTFVASLSSSPPPSSVGSAISVPDESPATPPMLNTSLNSSHLSSDSSSLAPDGIASIAAASSVAASLCPGVSGSGKSTFTAWFITEVMEMMHGLGDVKKPLPESAAIVEELVHQQMVSFVLQAINVSQLRNPSSSATRLELEDCFFLLRRNRIKLKRMFRFLKVSFLKVKSSGSNVFDEEGDAVEASQAKNKTILALKDFLRSIDVPGGSLATVLDDDEDDETDEVRLQRLHRAEEQSRRLSLQHYLEFQEARTVSFGGKSKTKSKFKDWLFVGSRELQNADIKVDPIALDVLCYLAKETVAEILDLSFLVQREAEVRIEDHSTYLLGAPSFSKLENPIPSSQASVSIPGLGGGEDPPLPEPRGPLQPRHIREAVSRSFVDSFSPFSAGRKSLDHRNASNFLFCV